MVGGEEGVGRAGHCDQPRLEHLKDTHLGADGAMRMHGAGAEAQSHSSSAARSIGRIMAKNKHATGNVAMGKFR